MKNHDSKFEPKLVLQFDIPARSTAQSEAKMRSLSLPENPDTDSCCLILVLAVRLRNSYDEMPDAPLAGLPLPET